MTRHVARLTRADQPLLDVFSAAGKVPPERLSIPQIEQIRRTARRTPEVMVKVTGGARSVFAPLPRISLTSATTERSSSISDQGERIPRTRRRSSSRPGTWSSLPGSTDRNPPRDLGHRVSSWCTTSCSPCPPARRPRRCSRPRRTSRVRSLAGHRYVMALHTHQRNPHVHLVVKAEHETEPGRLHIDKAMLREWRQDFARLMREQGIAANATSRAARGQTKRATKDVFYRTRRRGHPTRCARSSRALRESFLERKPFQIRRGLNCSRPGRP